MQNSVDWKRIPNATRIEATHASTDTMQGFVSTTTVSKYTHVELIRSEDEPCYVMTIPFFARELDLITALLPHVGWFVAATEGISGFNYNFDAFLEWEVDGGMWLSGVLESAN
jgi:hypothetical protein